MFLAILSHELRTPLNAIVGWMSILRADNRTEEVSTEGLDVIERNINVQVQLIEDILDMSRIVTSNVPALADSIWVDGGFPKETDKRPANTKNPYTASDTGSMQRFCVDRQKGMNVGFLGGSARPMAVKELWLLQCSGVFKPRPAPAATE